MSENENTGGAMGAGQSDAPDLEVGGGGDATGGGSMGDPDAMGSDEELTVEEGSGLATPKDAVDGDPIKVNPDEPPPLREGAPVNNGQTRENLRLS